MTTRAGRLWLRGRHVVKIVTDHATLISILIPAHNEAAYLGDCLKALLASDSSGYSAQIIVVANACTDATVDIARGFVGQAEDKGWQLEVIDTTLPGKLNALNLGEAAAGQGLYAYLDADVIVSPLLMGQIVAALQGDQPLYASGSPVVSQPKSSFTRAYARVWQQLPFVIQGVPGFGLFAVNPAGRARWGDFPDIIADDMFVRLNFSPAERVRVPAQYHWPMIEGFHNLVRVRRRQDAGVQEIALGYPDLLQNEDVARPSFSRLVRIGLSDPLGFVAYLAVKIAVKTPYARSSQRWARGR